MMIMMVMMMPASKWITARIRKLTKVPKEEQPEGGKHNAKVERIKGEKKGTPAKQAGYITKR